MGITPPSPRPPKGLGVFGRVRFIWVQFSQQEIVTRFLNGVNQNKGNMKHMTKKNFVALADHIRFENKTTPKVFNKKVIKSLERFCKDQNWAFHAETFQKRLNRI